MAFDAKAGSRKVRSGWVVLKDAAPRGEGVLVFQDAYRRVFFGQACDPLYPPHPAPSEVPEPELSRAALEDPAPTVVPGRRPPLHLLRWMLLVLIAVFGLGILIYWR